MGYSPWGYKQLDGSGTTEHTYVHMLLLKAAYALVAGVQKGFQRGAACLSEKVKAQPTQGVELMERRAEDDGYNRFSLLASALWLGSPLF